jgi:hypothetical protein
VIADDDSSEELLKEFGLEQNTEDMMVGIKDGKKRYPMEAMDDFDEDHIKEFLHMYKKGRHFISSSPLNCSDIFGEVKCVEKDEVGIFSLRKLRWRERKGKK